MTIWPLGWGTRSRRMAARRGVITVEFAIIGSALVTLTLAVLGAGLALWAMVGLQSSAAMAARCGAIAATGCTTAVQVQAYAVTQASAQILNGVIAAGDVTVISGATSCKGFSDPPRTFYTVSISSSYFNQGALAILAQPFNFTALKVSACYPMS